METMLLLAAAEKRIFYHRSKHVADLSFTVYMWTDVHVSVLDDFAKGGQYRGFGGEGVAVKGTASDGETAGCWPRVSVVA